MGLHMADTHETLQGLSRLGSEIYLRRQSLVVASDPERSVREPAARVKMSLSCRDMSETCRDNMPGTTCNHKSALHELDYDLQGG